LIDRIPALLWLKKSFLTQFFAHRARRNPHLSPLRKRASRGIEAYTSPRKTGESAAKINLFFSHKRAQKNTKEDQKILFLLTNFHELFIKEKNFLCVSSVSLCEISPLLDFLAL
jgi:hypothetical protein